MVAEASMWIIKSGGSTQHGTPPMPQLHTLKEVSATARISRRLLNRLRSAGDGPREIRLGRRVLVSEDALREWLAQREHAPRRDLTGRAEAA